MINMKIYVDKKTPLRELKGAAEAAGGTLVSKNGTVIFRSASGNYYYVAPAPEGVTGVALETLATWG